MAKMAPSLVMILATFTDFRHMHTPRCRAVAVQGNVEN